VLNFLIIYGNFGRGVLYCNFAGQGYYKETIYSLLGALTTSIFKVDQLNRLWTFAILMLLCGVAWGQARIHSITIIDYGIYATDISSSGRDAEGVLRSSVSNIRHAEDTTTIPAQLGVVFGFRFRVVGEPNGAKVAPREIVRYPAGGLRSPKSSKPIHSFEGALSQSVGEISLAWYRFDDPWELVPGNWIIELWSGDQKLAEQVFTVNKK
jgi:hypothetical protein